MKERPILFGGEMVRAILDGRKTQTRRVVKPAPCGLRMGLPYGKGRYITCPYGQPGDRLWVRETHAFVGSIDPGWLLYRASGYESECQRHGFDRPYPAVSSIKWRPSIHMPRWASRITLEITGVRVERLQEISEDDAKAEGCGLYVPGHGFITQADLAEGYSNYLAPRMGFEFVWTKINGPGSWDANPWVWVVEFKRLAEGAK